MTSKSSFSLNPGIRQMLSATFVVSGLIAALTAAPAFADDSAEIGKLIRAAKYGDAMVKVNAILAKTPRDAQTRFLKGVILTEQNKNTEAVAIFTKLTEDFPDLPEPYNNLAVLYASSGQYDKARTSLDMAIRTNPTYATAYENLGDVHARLASQAYDKALQLDSGNSAAKSKLTLVRTLVGNTTGGTNPQAGAAPVPAIAVVAKAEPVKPEPAAVAPPVPPVAKAEPVKPASVAVKTEPVKPAAPVDTGDKDDVRDAVNAWAKAWSAKDVKSYLNSYASDFETGNAASRKAWADERTARIVDKPQIDVGIQSLQVSVDGNTATAKFRQSYAAGSLKSTTRNYL